MTLLWYQRRKNCSRSASATCCTTRRSPLPVYLTMMSLCAFVWVVKSTVILSLLIPPSTCCSTCSLIFPPIGWSWVRAVCAKRTALRQRCTTTTKSPTPPLEVTSMSVCVLLPYLRLSTRYRSRTCNLPSLPNSNASPSLSKTNNSSKASSPPSLKNSTP